MATKRRVYSQAERRDLWARWSAGESTSEIAVALGRSTGTIHGTLAERGGVPPPVRHRAARALRCEEREEISRGIAGGASVREMARSLERAASTISREISRNGGRARYRAVEADRRAWRVAQRPQQCKLARNRPLRELVAAKLSEDWSPQQIAGWLALTHADDPEMRISHETIYLTLLVQARGALRRELIGHLRRLRSLRRPKGTRAARRRARPIPNPVSIRERPAEADDRAIPGHWEGDLLAGGRATHVATLVERTSRYTVLVKVQSKEADHIAEVLAARVLDLPTQLRRSLTWDRGSELARHAQFTVATDVAIYFCDPRSPWQRGTNENTNSLLRQYLGKSADLSAFSQEQLDAIALRLNTRPRTTLGYTTPAARLNELLR